MRVGAPARTGYGSFTRSFCKNSFVYPFFLYFSLYVCLCFCFCLYVLDTGTRILLCLSVCFLFVYLFVYLFVCILCFLMHLISLFPSLSPPRALLALVCVSPRQVIYHFCDILFVPILLHQSHYFYSSKGLAADRFFALQSSGVGFCVCDTVADCFCVRSVKFVLIFRLLSCGH